MGSHGDVLKADEIKTPFKVSLKNDDINFVGSKISFEQRREETRRFIC